MPTEPPKPPEFFEEEEHLVAYIDLLGFSETTRKLTGAARAKVLSLLQLIAASRGDYSSTSEKYGTSDGKLIRVQAATSSFSDSIVVSYPLGEVRKTGLNTMAAFVLLQRLLGAIAWRALETGHLIRGGMTVGPLYHANGIVFGPALLEVHKLESQVASYPRILVSPTVMQDKDIRRYTDGTFKDHDGLVCMEYMTNVLLRTDSKTGAHNPDVRPWLDTLLSLIAENAKTLKKEGDLRKLAKWQWLSTYLERVARQKPHLVASAAPSKV